MKKFKIVLWVIFIALVFLVYYQNRAFFNTMQSFTVNFKVAGPYQSRELPIAVWFLGTLCLGFLIAYFFALIEKFKTNRLVKGLKAKMENQEKEIAQLKQEVAPGPNFSSNDVVDAEATQVGTPGLETQKLPSDV